MYMIMFVLDNPEQLDDVLDSWAALGVSGVTIVESTGIARRRLARGVGTTFMSGINRLMTGDQENHVTLFSIVADDSTAAKCLAASEEIVGDLKEPNSGVFAAWPLTLIKGVPTNA